MSTAATKTKRLEVELEVCPTCHRVGRHPAGQYKGFCVGPAEETHKRVKTERRRFREVLSKGGVE